MNYSFLPSKIRKELETLISSSETIAQARSSSNIDGEPGESYIVAFKDQLFLFFRNSGEREYQHIKGMFEKNISFMDLRKDGIATIFDTAINGEKYSLKFSSFEEKNLAPILDFWKNNTKTPTEPKTEKPLSPEPSLGIATTPPPLPSNNSTQPTTSKTNSHTPTISSLIEALAIVLMYLASVDDDIAVEEDHYIRDVCKNKSKILASALKFYKAYSFDEYLSALPNLNQEQKLCFLANLMELGMCDGTLHKSEMNLIKRFTKFVNLSKDEYTTIKQVLIIKNNLSVLY